MPALPVLALIIGAAAGPLERPAADTLRAGAPAAADSVPATSPGDRSAVIATPAGVRRLAPPAVASDTGRRRAIEVSEWYNRRLLVHRITAIATPALFAYQYYLGNQLYEGTGDGDTRSTHRTMRSVIIGAFGVNAVTGAWNLWDSRQVSEGRTARVLHTASMVAAMGGFAWAGIKLADDMKSAQTADELLDSRRQHRAVALTSMGVTVVSGVAMWLVNR